MLLDMLKKTFEQEKSARGMERQCDRTNLQRERKDNT